MGESRGQSEFKASGKTRTCFTLNFARCVCAFPERPKWVKRAYHCKAKEIKLRSNKSGGSFQQRHDLKLPPVSWRHRNNALQRVHSTAVIKTRLLLSLLIPRQPLALCHSKVQIFPLNVVNRIPPGNDLFTSRFSSARPILKLSTFMVHNVTTWSLNVQWRALR